MFYIGNNSSWAASLLDRRAVRWRFGIEGGVQTGRIMTELTPMIVFLTQPQ